MPEVVTGQDVPGWGGIAPRRPDTKSRRERVAWPDELLRREV